MKTAKSILRFVGGCFIVAAFLWTMMSAQDTQSRLAFAYGVQSGYGACLEQNLRTALPYGDVKRVQLDESNDIMQVM